MKIPDLNAFCAKPAAAAGGLCIRFPGGFTLCLPDPRSGHVLTQIEGLLKLLNPALMPFGPIFTIINVVSAIIDVIKAIPGLVGPPPDPVAFLKALDKLLKAASKLLTLIPQASIPIFIKDILTVVAVFLRALATELDAFVSAAQRLAEATTLAADLGIDALSVEVSCAQDAFDIEMANLNESLGPISQILGIVNSMLELAGLEALSVDLTSADSPEDAIQALNSIADALETAASAIPV